MRGILAALMVAGAAWPAIAAQKVVRYELLTDPSDPNSAVAWTIDLELAAMEQSGLQVGWSLTSVTLTQLDSAGEAIEVWQDLSPELDTPDGLWWVTHVDPGEPRNAEFAQPPYIAGLGDAQISGSPGLDYFLEGAPSDPGIDALSYKFIVIGWAEPLRGGEIEWIDIPGELDPPTG